jgi:hypothetical protein
MLLQHAEAWAGARHCSLTNNRSFELDDVPSVTGAIPRELDGLYLHLAPSVELETRGRPVLHALRLRGGQAVWYRRRRLVRGRGSADEAEGTVATFRPTLFDHAGHILALVGGRPALEIDRECRVVGPFSFGGHLTDALHPRSVIVSALGDCHLLTDAASPRHFVFERGGRMRSQRRVLVDSQNIIDFGATANQLLLIANEGGQLVVTSLPTRKAPLRRWAVGTLKRNTAVYVVNAFEEDDVAQLDVIEYAESPARSGARLARWTLANDRRHAERSELLQVPASVQFASIDPNRVGRKHQLLVRATASAVNDAGSSELAIHDLCSGETQSYALGFGRSLSRPVHVPRDPARVELDGWLFVVIYDAVHDASDAAIFDVRKLSAGPIARVRLPASIPGAGEGLWTADETRGRDGFD